MNSGIVLRRAYGRGNIGYRNWQSFNVSEGSDENCAAPFTLAYFSGSLSAARLSKGSFYQAAEVRGNYYEYAFLAFRPENN